MQAGGQRALRSDRRWGRLRYRRPGGRRGDRFFFPLFHFHLAKASFHQRSQGGDGLVGVLALGHDADAFTLPGRTLAGHLHHTLGIHRLAALGHVLHSDLRGKLGGSLHEKRSGTGVQPNRIGDNQFDAADGACRCGRSLRRRCKGLCLGNFGEFHGGLGGALNLVQIVAQGSGHGSGDSAFHQWSIAQPDVCLLLWRKHLQHHLGGHHRAAQIHQNQDAVFAIHGVHRLLNPLKAGTKPPVFQAASRHDGQIAPRAHLTSHRADALGQFLAVCNNYDADQSDLPSNDF